MSLHVDTILFSTECGVVSLQLFDKDALLILNSAPSIPCFDNDAILISYSSAIRYGLFFLLIMHFPRWITLWSVLYRFLFSSQPEIFQKVRPRCEAPRRDMIYPTNYTPCRYVRISCLRGNPIAIFFVQVYYNSFTIFCSSSFVIVLKSRVTSYRVVVYFVLVYFRTFG